MWDIRSVASELSRRIKRFIPWLSYEKRFRFGEVDFRKLYRSSKPNRRALTYFVRKYELRSVVVLTENYDEREKEFIQSVGLTFVHIPLKTETPPSEDQISYFFSFVTDSANQPTLVHCIQGRDRTGCLCFIYRFEKMGWSAYMAWHEMKSFGFYSLPKHRLTHGSIKKWLERRYNLKFA